MGRWVMLRIYRNNRVSGFIFMCFPPRKTWACAENLAYILIAKDTVWQSCHYNISPDSKIFLNDYETKMCRLTAINGDEEGVHAWVFRTSWWGTSLQSNWPTLDQNKTIPNQNKTNAVNISLIQALFRCIVTVHRGVLTIKATGVLLRHVTSIFFSVWGLGGVGFFLCEVFSQIIP